jgi:8-oxo-dGTP diphosphatase
MTSGDDTTVSQKTKTGDQDSWSEPDVVAAGGVLWKVDGRTGTARVLVVHRPRYDDWSFPKGKSEPDETPEETALREVLEETGLACRIIVKLAESRYPYRSKAGKLLTKVVHYYLMEATATQTRFKGDEVDRSEWLAIEDAAHRLTYDADCEVLNRAVAFQTDLL